MTYKEQTADEKVQTLEKLYLSQTNYIANRLTYIDLEILKCRDEMQRKVYKQVKQSAVNELYKLKGERDGLQRVLNLITTGKPEV